VPQFSKKVLSQYFRTECKRQLRLYLSPPVTAYQHERDAQNMPPPQPPRPGLEQFAQAGEEWQAAKLHDLTETFGQESVVGEVYTHDSGQVRYRSMPLEEALAGVSPGRFLVEAEYQVGRAFEEALGISGFRERFGLDYSGVRPDIMEVFPAGHFNRLATPSGETQILDAGDRRLQLRVIDIKLTAEPSPGYFAEVTYYAMVLAGWLADNGLDDRFVVVPDGAVWPGSHEAAVLTVTHKRLRDQGAEPTDDQLREAMEEDLELVPFEVFAYRLRRFLQEEIPEVLSMSWRDLPWHVDNRCKGCENLGYPWVNADGERTDHPDHCMPEAERTGQLSRIAFVTRGASAALQGQGVRDVASLAVRVPEDPAFGSHHVLRATRTVVSGRARALHTGEASIPAGGGSSAVMPRWTDLHIYLSADFDLSSAVTFAFGLQAFWIEPRPYGSPETTPRQTHPWRAQTFVVDQKDLAAERRELLAFLNGIDAILTDAQGRNNETTVQFYLWDSLQYEHLTRVVGRHLEAILANGGIQRLAWLFPPEEVLPNPRLSTRRSPITVVKEVARATLAAPIPHYYSLLDTARSYHEPSLPDSVAQFSVHPLFEDALSDQIPSERAHEMWSRATTPRHWTAQMLTLQETVTKRLRALETVTRRLETDLRSLLPRQAAPRIQQIRPPDREPVLSVDGQLWYAFARLNEAMQELEVQQLRAMPPHQREAKFESARLPERLMGAAATAVLEDLGLRPQPGRRVYRLSPNSREVKFNERELDLALAPEDWPDFLDRAVLSVTQGTPLERTYEDVRQPVGEATKVTVVRIDRERGVLVLDPRRRPGLPSLEELEDAGIADFDRNVVLDRTYQDYFTRKLRAALRAIGNPPEAHDNPLVRRATGQLRGRGSRRTGHTPAADLLWSARVMHATRVSRELPPVRARLEEHGLTLNNTQWSAWEEALSRRLTLMWGPPGTGKSRTARLAILGAALEAYQRNRPLRVLICAQNYNAMDNVLLEVNDRLQDLLPEGSYEVHRLRSYLRPRDQSVPEDIDAELNQHRPSGRIEALLTHLWASEKIVVVGATPHLVLNLLVTGHDRAQREFFDLILVDEATQMEVALAILALTSLAEGGSVVLAGDPKQLPPILQAEPPLGLESMVGSIYRFCEDLHEVEPVMLEVNYRSNATLVEFSLEAGYRRALNSHSTDLRLNLTTPLPSSQPENWPVTLYWTPEWSSLLDPDCPAACFAYPEGRSSQWNQFEADAVAALVTLLYDRMGDQLHNERHPTRGELVLAAGRTVYSSTEFWERAIGVVTPHRAQQGLIISRLQEVFAGTGVAPDLIRSAVDTVERFQGQERDVIIASYALGDPDAIGDEDEFLMSMNRFNVMASRARAKLIVFVSQEVINHLSSDLDTLRGSRLLKTYIDSFCEQARPIALGVLEDGSPRPVPGSFRYREHRSDR
jgi:DNA replication ATP-dependent helicase Dna2